MVRKKRGRSCSQAKTPLRGTRSRRCPYKSESESSDDSGYEQKRRKTRSCQKSQVKKSCGKRKQTKRKHKQETSSSDSKSNESEDTDSRQNSSSADEEPQTPYNQDDQLPEGRSSERIRSRRNKEFCMPTRKEVFERITEAPSTSVRTARRSLASSFTRETHSYNQDMLSDSELSSVEDFVISDNAVESSSEEEETPVHRRIDNEDDVLERAEEAYEARKQHSRIMNRIASSSEESYDTSSGENKNNDDDQNVESESNDSKAEGKLLAVQADNTPPQKLMSTSASVGAPASSQQVLQLPYHDEDDSEYGIDVLANNTNGPQTSNLQSFDLTNRDTATEKELAEISAVGEASKEQHGQEGHMHRQRRSSIEIESDDDLSVLVMNVIERVETESKTRNPMVGEQSSGYLLNDDVVKLLPEDKDSIVLEQDSDEEHKTQTSTPIQINVNTNMKEVLDSGKRKAPSNGPGNENVPESDEEKFVRRKANRSVIIDSGSDDDDQTDMAKGSVSKNKSHVTPKNRKPCIDDSDDTSEEEIGSHRKVKRSLVIDSDEDKIENSDDHRDTDADSSQTDSDGDCHNRRGSKRARLMRSRKDSWREKFKNYRMSRKKSGSEG